MGLASVIATGVKGPRDLGSNAFRCRMFRVQRRGGQAALFEERRYLASRNEHPPWLFVFGVASRWRASASNTS